MQSINGPRGDIPTVRHASQLLLCLYVLAPMMCVAHWGGHYILMQFVRGQSVGLPVISHRRHRLLTRHHSGATHQQYSNCRHPTYLCQFSPGVCSLTDHHLSFLNRAPMSADHACHACRTTCRDDKALAKNADAVY